MTVNNLQEVARRNGVHALYSTMNSIETKLGGGEGLEGCYGSITEQNMQRIYEAMRVHTGFGPESSLIDIGAGLGK